MEKAPEMKMDDLNIDGRRRSIMDFLAQNGRVRVAELSKLFGTSEVTIRNDLSELEQAGMLERVHGGAVSTYKAYYNMTLNDRAKTNEDEKKAIATAAVSSICEGDTIMVGSGTTTLFVVQGLRSVKNLTIVTNSLPIAQEVAFHKNMQVILLGGNLNPQYQFTYGDDTLNQLKRYKADKLILSADGVSGEEGITTYHHLEAEINRMMITRVNKTIVVADFSKIGRTSFAYIEGIESADLLVTDQKANRDELNEITKKGIEVVVA